MLTFWGRKSIATEIGTAGVTEILVRLQNLARCGTSSPEKPCAPDVDPDNFYLAIGHSFGADVMLSALNEVLLYEILAASHRAYEGERQGCVLTDRFNDGVVLLNPAIEANQALQLKELTSRLTFCPRQPVLMNVLSSTADSATRVAFPVARWLGVLGLAKRNLPRARGPVHYHVEEAELDTVTVGNFAPFWTGLLHKEKHDPNRRWKYHSLTDRKQPRDLQGRAIANHYHSPHNNPIHITYTDSHFIRDHAHVFNRNVLAFASAVVNDSLSRVRGRPVSEACTYDGPDADGPGADSRANHVFGSCFEDYWNNLRDFSPAED
jgi:hypothetical protein